MNKDPQSSTVPTPPQLLDPVDGWDVDYLLSFAAKRCQDELENGDYVAKRLRTLRDRFEAAVLPTAEPRRKFSDLRAEMSPESQERARVRSEELLAEMPTAEPRQEQDELEALRRWKKTLEKMAKVMRLEDAIATAEHPSELHRRLRAFEIASVWRKRAEDAERELRTIKQSVTPDPSARVLALARKWREQGESEMQEALDADKKIAASLAAMRLHCADELEAAVRIAPRAQE